MITVTVTDAPLAHRSHSWFLSSVSVVKVAEQVLLALCCRRGAQRCRGAQCPQGPAPSIPALLLSDRKPSPSVSVSKREGAMSTHLVSAGTSH